MSLDNEKVIGKIIGANFPMDEQGRTYHVGLKSGELANLVLMVGDNGRANLLKSLLDMKDGIEYHSGRGFLTFTGTFNGARISIMSIGMGLAMADFAIREMRAIVKGPLFILRLGTCGTLAPFIKLGSVVAAKDSYAITTNFDAHIKNSKEDGYHFSKTINADPMMYKSLVSHLKKDIPQPYDVVEGTDATSDFFYSSQGRIDENFLDHNEQLFSLINRQAPETISLQMETFQLYFLSHIGKDIRAASAAIVVAQRHQDDFLSKEELKILELSAGEACLKTLASFA